LPRALRDGASQRGELAQRKLRGPYHKRKAGDPPLPRKPKPKSDRPVGKPPHERTEERATWVHYMLASGRHDQADMAKALGISVPTLRKHYRPELKNAISRINAIVTQSALMQAIGAQTRTGRRRSCR
jgi:hypothetical protein